MFINAALRDPLKHQDPATYASGGPTWNVIDIYKIAAPTLNVEAPDIYARDYPTFMAHLKGYHRPDNPLFVPEIGNDQPFTRYFFAVLGNQAIGFVPFGMDFSGYGNYPLGAKSVDDKEITAFADNFRLIAPMAREWAKLSFESNVWGTSEPEDHKAQTIALGPWAAKVSYRQATFWFTRDVALIKSDSPFATLPPRGGVLIAQLGPGEFLITGAYARVEFGMADPKSKLHVQYDRVEEGRYENGKWVLHHVWNGDQTDWGLNFTSRPQVLRVKLATF
jgi:beta-galactosidase GanA